MAWVWIRMRPWHQDGLRRYAELERQDRIQANREPLYALSIWAAVGPAAVSLRLTKLEAEWHMTVDRISVVPRRELRAFRIEPTPDVEGHFDLVLGAALEDADIEHLASIFNSHARRNR
jgi:hypothetical protein